MKFLKPAIAASVMLFVFSCNKHPDVKDAAVTQEQLFSPPAVDTTIIPQDENIIQKNGSPENINWDKKIIKTATINVEVKDYKKYNASIHELIRKYGAYVASEQENNSDYKIESILTIKIPVQYFDEALQQVAAQPGKLLEKHVTAEDVTGEYLDTRARMEAKKRVRLRYLDMLKKARNMEEILQVEREINSMQEQIEAAEGRVNYLNHSAAYSTVQLTFFQVLDARGSDPEHPSFGKRVLIAFSNGAKWVSELLLVLVTMWPVWLALAVFIWLMRKITRPKSQPKNITA